MFNAVLRQIPHHPKVTAATLRQMIVQEILNNYDQYEELLLLGGDLTLQEYLLGILDQSVWGEITILGIIGKIFNLSISVISPAIEKDIHLFHKDSKPDILIVANGSFEGSKDATTHFSATGKF